MGKCYSLNKNNKYSKGIDNEAIIIDNEICGISDEQKNIIKNQKEKSICAIEVIENNKKIKVGTGFLCLIPYLNNKSHQLPVLITCNHVLDENNFKEGKEIYLLFNDNNKKKLNIDKNRKKYTNNELDITIIEIKKEDDNFNNKNFIFLEIDDKIFRDENLEKIFSKEIIYIIYYPQGLFATCCYKKIIKIINNIDIKHNCDTLPGSSGAPIFNLKNNKVLGLHKGYDNEFKLNAGLILKEPLLKFGILKHENVKKNIKNEIYLTLEVTENDINKDIYFLDNSFFDYKNAINKPHSFLSELNDSNVKVFINEQKEDKYKKYFRPEAKGLYKIRLEIDTLMKDCRNMFEFCNNIKEIDLSNFYTGEVVDMSCMFKDCKRLEKVNLTDFSTKNVSNMEYMFYNCNNLGEIDLSFFETKKVISMENMFSKCIKLEELLLFSFNTKNVINMKNMFSDCSHLTYLDLTSFNTQNVTDMSAIFLNCSKLKNIKLSNSFTTDKVTSMKQMFCGCNSLKDINLTHFNTINVIDMSEMFSCCNSLTYLNLTSFDTRNVINMRMMFNKCNDLFNISLNNSTFVNDKCRDMTKMFSGCHSCRDLNISHFHFQDRKIDNIFEDSRLAWMQNTSMLTMKK